MRAIIDDLRLIPEERRGEDRRRIVLKLRLHLIGTACFKVPIDAAFDALLEPEMSKNMKGKQATALRIRITRLIASNERFV